MRFLIVALAIVAVASAANVGINENDVRIGNTVGNNSPDSNNMVMNNVKTNMNNAVDSRGPMGRTNNVGINRASTGIDNYVGNNSPGANNMVMNNVDTKMNNRATNRPGYCWGGWC